VRGSRRPCGGAQSEAKAACRLLCSASASISQHCRSVTLAPLTAPALGRLRAAGADGARDAGGAAQPRLGRLALAAAHLQPAPRYPLLCALLVVCGQRRGAQVGGQRLVAAGAGGAWAGQRRNGDGRCRCGVGVEGQRKGTARRRPASGRVRGHEAELQVHDVGEARRRRARCGCGCGGGRLGAGEGEGERVGHGSV
jgi:hypothetical protein